MAFNPFVASARAVLIACIVWAGGAAEAATSCLDAAKPFVVVDDANDRVFRFGTHGISLDSFALDDENDAPRDIADAGGFFYVLDSQDRTVYRYDSSTGSRRGVSRELRQRDGTSLSVPGGLAVDGDVLWVVDRGRAKLYRYSREQAFSTGTRVSAIEEARLAEENARAEGIAIDFAFLYVIDESDKQIYRYRRYGNALVDASAVLQQVDGSSLGAPSGVAVSDVDLLIVDRSRDEVYRYGLAQMFGTGGPLPAKEECEDGPKKEDPKKEGPAPDSGYGLAVKTDDYGLDAEQDELKGIRARHNQQRKAAPKADPKLVDLDWKVGLTRDARTYAGLCMFGHSAASNAGKVGENLYAAAGHTKKDLAQTVVDDWAGESALYKVEDNSCDLKSPKNTRQPPYNSCGHYTQIVFDDARGIGCWAEFCTKNSVFIANYEKQIKGLEEQIKQTKDREEKDKLTKQLDELKKQFEQYKKMFGNNWTFVVCQYDKIQETGKAPYKPFRK